MGTPHIHANEIKAWADGLDIQRLHHDGKWEDDFTPTWSGSQIYRIKPEPKYPETRMDDDELRKAQADASVPCSSADEFRAIANAAIRRAIQDGDVVLPEGKA